MRKIWIIAVFFLSAFSGFSQQDPMFSQYMFNGLAVNPAYAGSRDAISGVFLFRAQWTGISGAPMTQTLSVHSPSKNRRHGFGVTLINDKISYLGQTWINVDYAFRIPLGNGRLALGLQGSFYNYRINWEKADLIDNNDALPGNYGRNFYLPNAGFGIYYSTNKWYAGVSVPHLLVNSLDKSKAGISFSSTEADYAILKRHYFVTAGYVFDLNRFLKLKPSFLYKYVYGAPMQFDINLNLYFYNRFGVGVSYRTRDGIVAMIDYQITKQLRAGYAFDYPFTKLAGYTYGSHEIMIGYDLRFGNKAVVSPRLF